MENFKLLALMLLITQITAFSAPGAFERMYFYYAYLADTPNGTPATKIAVGCANAMRTGGRPCNFNQFIEYINEDPLPKGVHITDEREPDVRRTAQALVDETITGGYSYQKIRSDISNSKATAVLFTDLARVVQSIGPGASRSIKDGLTQAAQAIYRTRMAASIGHLEKEFGKVGKSVVPMPIALFDGSTEMIQKVNPGATSAANGWTRKQYIEACNAAMSTEKNHAPNIEAAKQAAAVVEEACT